MMRGNPCCARSSGGEEVTDWTKIGTVELLRLRVYPADPATVLGEDVDVLVPAGTYPLYRNGDGKTRWIMTGKRNRREVKTERLGDGLFSIWAVDKPEKGGWIEVSSPTFSAGEFEEFLSGELCQPGPEQRLVFRIGEAMSA